MQIKRIHINVHFSCNGRQCSKLVTSAVVEAEDIITQRLGMRVHIVDAVGYSLSGQFTKGESLYS